MLTDLTGKELIPPVGHSITTPQTGTKAKKGSISSGGPLSPRAKFLARQQMRENILRKSDLKQQMTERIMRRLDAVDTFLSDDEIFFEKLADAKLRDLAIMEGVYIDKLQQLTGQATTIISVQHQQKIDQLLPLLMQAMQQRGLHLKATERKVELTQLPSP